MVRNLKGWLLTIEALKPEPKPTKSSAGQKIFRQMVAVLLSILLVWFAFAGANLKQIWHYASNANWAYLSLMCLCALTSHLLRSWRWLLLLQPLSSKKISLWHSFCAVIYGYAVNVAIPRGGELVRLLSIAKSENLPIAGVLSTLLIDRLLDIALLMLLFGATLTILPQSIIASLPWLEPGGVILSIITVVALIMLPFAGRIISSLIALPSLKRLLPPRFEHAAKLLVDQFNEGTKSLTNPLLYPAITLLSLAIWFLYWLNTYLIVKALHLSAVVSLLQSFIVFTVGSVGVLIPTPGSIGSYHFLVSQTLILTCGLNKDLALAFASTLHALAFILVPCPTALLCLLINFCLAKRASKNNS